MHSKGKGMSKSALPFKRSAPGWLKTTAQEVRTRRPITRVRVRGRAGGRAPARACVCARGRPRPGAGPEGGEGKK